MRCITLSRYTSPCDSRDRVDCAVYTGVCLAVFISVTAASCFLFYHFLFVFFFFFQAEDGIRDWSVTGVQTCALPISRPVGARLRCFFSADRPVDLGLPIHAATGALAAQNRGFGWQFLQLNIGMRPEIGRASCRERV